MASTTLHSRLLRIQSDFLAAIEDPAAIISFDQTWAELYTDLEAAWNAGTLDSETATLAGTVAHTITTISTDALALETDTENITDELLQMFNERLNLDESPAPAAPAASRLASPPLPPKPAPAPSVPRTDSSLPLYIEPAYRWLLKHLHNPYPKKEVKEQLADASPGTTVEQISAWFVDARRRMGWTRLLNDRFGRCRADLVDAAKRYFVSADPKRPISPEIQGRFVEIETFAKTMYAAKLLPSELAIKMSAAVKDLTPELQEKARRDRLTKAKAAKAYPSPGPSSPFPDSGSWVAGRKRSSSESSEAESSSSGSRKRSRCDDDDDDTLPTPPDSARTSPAPSSAPNRKRRLSESEAQGAPTKRPRFRNASAPAPSTVTLSADPGFLSDWFTIQNSSASDIFDSARPLDIKLFDPSEFELFDEDSCASSPSGEGSVSELPEPDMVTFDLTPGQSAELQHLFDSFPPDFYSTPGIASFESFTVEPEVYQATDFVVDPYINGHNSFITRESAENVVCGAYPDAAAKAGGLLVDMSGLYEPHQLQQQPLPHERPSPLPMPAMYTPLPLVC